MFRVAGGGRGVGRGFAAPSAAECTMNRAPTLVRPAANEMQLGQHAVLPLPKYSGRVADASLPRCRLGRHAVPTLPGGFGLLRMAGWLHS